MFWALWLLSAGLLLLAIVQRMLVRRIMQLESSLRILRQDVSQLDSILKGMVSRRRL